MACAGVARAGEAGLRDRLATAFVRAQRVWPPAPDPSFDELFEDGPDQHWRRRHDAPPDSGLAWREACPVDTSGSWGWAESADCSTQVWSRFAVDGDTLDTTFGHVPEECNETPRLQWRDRHGRAHREPLPLATDFNVSALWITDSWLVLGLTVRYEGFQADWRLAVWNLASGAWRQTPRLTWPDGDKPVVRPPRPFDLLGGIAGVQVAERSGALFVRRGPRGIVLWPAARAWSFHAQ